MVSCCRRFNQPARTTRRTRKNKIVGCTPNPDEAFVLQACRSLTTADDGLLVGERFLICDRDRKWSTRAQRLLEEAGVRVVRTPFQAPNCNAHAERFVRAIKEECLTRVILFGEQHLRRAINEFVAHYHRERNHQGISNELIDRPFSMPGGRIRRRQRLGGLFNYYYRAA
jgi:putative transposase